MHESTAQWLPTRARALSTGRARACWRWPRVFGSRRPPPARPPPRLPRSVSCGAAVQKRQEQQQKQRR
eukprot:4544280-Pyramimonas_sp.AAC.1